MKKTAFSYEQVLFRLKINRNRLNQKSQEKTRFNKEYRIECLLLECKQRNLSLERYPIIVYYLPVGGKTTIR